MKANKWGMIHAMFDKTASGNQIKASILQQMERILDKL